MLGSQFLFAPYFPAGSTISLVLHEVIKLIRKAYLPARLKIPKKSHLFFTPDLKSLTYAFELRNFKLSNFNFESIINSEALNPLKFFIFSIQIWYDSFILN